MNYDHAFHAGNFADVVKHIILARLIAYLRRKPSAFRVIDTHAGAGRHDLVGRAADTNPEWREGIARLLEADLPPEIDEFIAPYLGAVRGLGAADILSAYPGSPLLAKMLMRPEDRLTAMELNPEAHAGLRALFAGDPQVKVLGVDGYQALPAQLPPKQTRALVLIDPPFEQAGEFARMVQALIKAHRIFPQGVYALWYPLKDDAGVAGFKEALFETAIPDIHFSEFRLRAPSTPPRLYGSGMILVNPPYLLDSELDRIFAALLPVLAVSGTASFENGVIRPE
ncbi:MAG: 23S rRNA (adenine(2030)-N(6))-methyltransferase RlmJ [Alphaproteobacteria bacterium]|nr:23S rRNA (adenine(2030)-N(6))-methyltransferase RlmJ [Alphaproteobacteria bacterium]